MTEQYIQDFYALQKQVPGSKFIKKTKKATKCDKKTILKYFKIGMKRKKLRAIFDATNSRHLAWDAGLHKAHTLIKGARICLKNAKFCSKIK